MLKDWNQTFPFSLRYSLWFCKAYKLKETYLLLNSKNTKTKKTQPHPNICVQCDEKTQCGCKIGNWCKNKHSF